MSLIIFSSTPPLNAQSPESQTVCTFTRTLHQGLEGDDVLCLQSYLFQEGYFPYPQGSGTFGPETVEAVTQWQLASGITPFEGYFGPQSRATYQQLFSLLEIESQGPVSSSEISKITLLTTLRSLLTDLVTLYHGMLGGDMMDTNLAPVDISAAQGDTKEKKTLPKPSGFNIARSDNTGPIISSITATPSATSATITWITDEEATSHIDYGETTSYGSNESSSTLITSHSISIAGLTSETTYHYKVTSVDEAGNTTESSDQTFTTTDGTAPTAPTLSVTADSSTAVTLTIILPSEDEATMAIYRDTSSITGDPGENAGIRIATPAATDSYTDSTLSANTTYYYRVTLTDDSDNESVFSNEDSVTTPPGIPQNVLITDDTTGSITLDWDDVVGASSYTVYYGETEGGPYPLSTTSEASEKVVTDLIPSTSYYFRVSATGAGGEGEVSEEVGGETDVPK